MSDYPFRIEALDQHDRAEFSCGRTVLDQYFRQQVTQDLRRRITACYVAVCNVTDRVAGFYTLSAAQIAITQLPEDLKKKLPRYPSVPAVRIGRLAIDSQFQEQGLGETLLINAINRILKSGIAAYAVIVDAKDEKAADFYRHYDFLELNGQDRTLFIPLSRFVSAFSLFDA